MKKLLLAAAVAGTMVVLTTACSDTATSPVAPPLTSSATRAVAATTIKFGPIAVTGAEDYGSCNNVWALDSFNKSYTITPLGGTSYGVQVDYKGGSFVTEAGTSPGACNGGTASNGHTVAANITGSMKQQYNGTVTSLNGPVAGAKCTAATCTNTQTTLDTIFGVDGWHWVTLTDGGHWAWANVYKTSSNGTYTDTNDGTHWVTSGDIN